MVDDKNKELMMIKILPMKEEQLDVFLELIRELADFEEMLNEVICDKDKLYKSFFVEKYAKPYMIYYDEQIVGYMIYYFTFSSFLGTGGLHLEDLYVREAFRDKGCGKKAFEYLINICKEKNLERIEWVCLRGNEKAINFYEKKLGADDISKVWLLYRLDKEGINSLKL